MARETGIEWTDATWNPIRGCSRVSEGCRHCYAEVVANRFCGPGSPYEGVVRIGADGKGTGQWNGEIKFVEERLLDPLRWKKPQKIFVNSMSDLFHEKVTDHMRDQIFAVMAMGGRHTFQILTKRPANMLRYLTRFKTATEWRNHLSSLDDADQIGIFHEDADCFIANAIEGCLAPGCNVGWPMRNVWLGVSVENQQAADERIPLLLQTPAAVRFLSVEPLLGPVDLHNVQAPDDPEKEWKFTALDAGDVYWGGPGAISDGPEHNALDWVICGGESGPGARPMHPDWARSLRDQCAAAGVPFFFKQWGEWLPLTDYDPFVLGKDTSKYAHQFTWRTGEPNDKELPISAFRVGKKAAGHLLEDEEHHAFPEVRA